MNFIFKFTVWVVNALKPCTVVRCLLPNCNFGRKKLDITDIILSIFGYSFNRIRAGRLNNIAFVKPRFSGLQYVPNISGNAEHQYKLFF